MNTMTSMEEIEKRAAQWILDRDREGASDEDRAALETWLSQDARHREAYLALDELWELSAGMKQWHPRDGHIDPDLLASLADEPSRPNRLRAWSLAAAVLAVVGGLGWLGFVLQRGESYSTPVGGYERIALDDGSVLQLNTDTAVQTHFTDSQRTVRMLRGEAYFDVAQDPRRPFEVRVGNSVARAVGTAFSVRVGAGEKMELMVTQGRVMLMSDGASGEQPLIAAGQSARAKAKALEVVPVRRQEIDRRLAWQGGQLVFDREPLSEVAAEFNRYNHRQVDIASAGLRDLRFTGNFKATDLDSFVAAIESAAEVRIERTERALVIRER